VAEPYDEETLRRLENSEPNPGGHTARLLATVRALQDRQAPSSDRVHALVTPWPIGREGTPLFTWCGKRCDTSATGRIAFKPSAIDCPRCRLAMRQALENLQEWVPGLDEPAETTNGESQ